MQQQQTIDSMTKQDSQKMFMMDANKNLLNAQILYGSQENLNKNKVKKQQVPDKSSGDKSRSPRKRSKSNKKIGSKTQRQVAAAQQVTHNTYADMPKKPKDPVRDSSESHISGIAASQLSTISPQTNSNSTKIIQKSPVIGNTQRRDKLMKIAKQPISQSIQSLPKEILRGSLEVIDQGKQSNQQDHSFESYPKQMAQQQVIQYSHHPLQLSDIQNHNQSIFSSISALQQHPHIQNQINQLTNDSIKISQLKQLPVKIYENIEEAKSILKMCVLSVNGVSVQSTNNASIDINSNHIFNQLQSILSQVEPELDSNIICPSCKYIAVNAVECQPCEFIVCYQCAKKNDFKCPQSSCNQQLGNKPGKIHKLYRQIFAQLEFRCPNQCFNHISKQKKSNEANSFEQLIQCQSILKYDEIDSHLKDHCTLREIVCPHACDEYYNSNVNNSNKKNFQSELNPKKYLKKYTIQDLQEHLNQSCPCQPINCKDCEQIILRGEIQNHKDNDCPQVEEKCKMCDQIDKRGLFQEGKHDCIKVLKSTINKLKDTNDHNLFTKTDDKDMKTKDQSLKQESMPRSLEDYRHSATKKSQEIKTYESNITLKSGQPEIEFVIKQLKNLKKEQKDLETLVTEDVFQMFDHLSLCVTQKDEEVKNLKTQVTSLTKNNAELQQLLQEQTSHLKEIFQGFIKNIDSRFVTVNQQISQQNNQFQNQLDQIKNQIDSQVQTDRDKQSQKTGFFTAQQNRVVPRIQSDPITNYNLTQTNSQTPLESFRVSESIGQMQSVTSLQGINSQVLHQQSAYQKAQQEIQIQHQPLHQKQNNQKQTETEKSFENESESVVSMQQKKLDEMNKNNQMKQNSLKKNRAQTVTDFVNSNILDESSDFDHQFYQQLPGSIHSISQQQSFMNSGRSRQIYTPTLINESNKNFPINPSISEIQNPMIIQQQKANKELKNAADSGTSSILIQEKQEDFKMKDGKSYINSPAAVSQGQFSALSRGQLFPQGSGSGNNGKGIQNKQMNEVQQNRQFQSNQECQENANEMSPFQTSEFSMGLTNDEVIFPGLTSERREHILESGNCKNNFSRNISNIQQAKSLETYDDGNCKDNQSLQNLEHNMHHSSLESLETFRVDINNKMQLKTRALQEDEVQTQINFQNQQSKNKDNDTSLMDAYSENTNKFEENQDANDDSFANSEQQDNSKSFVDEAQQSDSDGQQSSTELQRVTRSQNYSNQESIRPEINIIQLDDSDQTFRNLEELVRQGKVSEEDKRQLEEDFLALKNMKQISVDQMLIRQAKRQLAGQDNADHLDENEEDEEEGNQTENEVIQKHLESLQGIGGQKQMVYIPSALKGLESDLETIFETDMESNYVTTARTNLSTKKLLNQINYMAALQQSGGHPKIQRMNQHSEANNQQFGTHQAQSQERLGRILSQCSPIVNSGNKSLQKSQNQESNNDIRQQRLLEQLENNEGGRYRVTQAMPNMPAGEAMSPGGNNSDTSASLLISARSNQVQVQQVKSSQNRLHPCVDQQRQNQFIFDELQESDENDERQENRVRQLRGGVSAIKEDSNEDDEYSEFMKSRGSYIQSQGSIRSNFSSSQALQMMNSHAPLSTSSSLHMLNNKQNYYK